MKRLRSVQRALNGTLVVHAFAFGLCAHNLAAAAEPDYLALVRQCADVLIEHGRDRYGEIHAPIFMANLDPATLDSPREPPLLDGRVRTEGREHRRNPGGSDLWEDQTLLRVLTRLTELTGEAKYEQAARDYVAYYFEHCTKPSTGLLAWGTHLYWDAFAEQPGGDDEGRGPHETLISEPDWAFMASIAPEAVARQIELTWDWHMVDPATGLFNRHDDRRHGCDFAFMGAELAYAFAFMQTQTGDPVWQERGHLLADWHWGNRHPETGLAPDAPGIDGRYDGNHCFTTLPGPHASLLLRAYASTDDPFYLDIALGHLRAYLEHGWDAEAESFWGMLRLDGTPVEEDDRARPRDIDEYGDFQPVNHVEPWRTIMYSYEFPLIAAQSYAYAAELTGDEQMIEGVRRWAGVYERAMPPKPGRRWSHLLAEALPGLANSGGTYAENYGRAIDFFLRASAVLDEPRYATIARELAAEAIDKLRDPATGLFRGHPAKPSYEATDGVGYLLYALLQLELYPTMLAPNL